MVLVLNAAGNLYFDCGWVGAALCSTCPSLFDDDWHHVAVTVEFNVDGGVNDALTIYIDGVADGSRSNWDLQTWAVNGTVDGAVGDFKAGYSCADFPRNQNTFFTAQWTEYPYGIQRLPVLKSSTCMNIPKGCAMEVPEGTTSAAAMSTPTAASILPIPYRSSATSSAALPFPRVRTRPMATTTVC